MTFTNFAGMPAAVVIQTEKERKKSTICSAQAYPSVPTLDLSGPTPSGFLMVSSTDLQSRRQLPQNTRADPRHGGYPLISSRATAKKALRGNQSEKTVPTFLFPTALETTKGSQIAKGIDFRRYRSYSHFLNTNLENDEAECVPSGVLELSSRPHCLGACGAELALRVGRLQA